MPIQEDIVIQERDVKLLQLLLHTRILTLKHAAALLFDGSKEAAKKRIQKLKANGLILERTRRAYEAGILSLSKKGFECIRVRGAVPEVCSDIRSFSKRGKGSDLTLQHELEVLDVKIAFHDAVRKNEQLSLPEFSTWPRLFEFTVDYLDDSFVQVRKPVRPDGFIRLHEHDPEGGKWEHLFFLEVDRSTEKLDTFVERLKLYGAHYRAGGMAKRFGQPTEKFHDYPFRVLVVCKSEERRDNIAKLLLSQKTPVLTQVCLTTLKEVCSSPFSKVWRVPADYQPPRHINSDFEMDWRQMQFAAPTSFKTLFE